MSNLSKTITIPPASPETILGKPVLKMVILGYYPNAVDLANELAIEPPTSTDRWVLWFPQPESDQIRTLFPSLQNNYSSLLGFVLSTTNKIADLLLVNETIDTVRIDQAYTQGGLPQYNS